MKPFLLALRAQVIPADLMPFLYDIQPPVSFVDGCLVVEIQDFRKEPEGRSRVVMRPAAEALSQTIDTMLERKGQNWDERMTLELESRIIVSHSQRQCWFQVLIVVRHFSPALPRHVDTSHAQCNTSNEHHRPCGPDTLGGRDVPPSSPRNRYLHRD